MLEQYRVLGAMAVLGEFDVPQLARVTGINRKSVANVIDRRSELLEEADAPPPRNGRRGRPTKRLRIRADQVGALEQLLAQFQTTTELAEEVSNEFPPEERRYQEIGAEDIPATLIAAQVRLTKEFPDLETVEERRAAIEVAELNLGSALETLDLKGFVPLAIENCADVWAARFVIALSAAEVVMGKLLEEASMPRIRQASVVLSRLFKSYRALVGFGPLPEDLADRIAKSPVGRFLAATAEQATPDVSVVEIGGRKASHRVATFACDALLESGVASRNIHTWKWRAGQKFDWRRPAVGPVFVALGSPMEADRAAVVRVIETVGNDVAPFVVFSDTPDDGLKHLAERYDGSFICVDESVNVDVMGPVIRRFREPYEAPALAVAMFSAFAATTK